MGDKNPFQLADVLGQFVARSGYTSGQLAKLSGIPKPTIVNWMEGRVRRPRGVDDLLRLTAVLHLTEPEASALLQAASHPDIADLRQSATQTGNDEQLGLLSRWVSAAPKRVTAVPFQVTADLLPYFVGRTAEIAQLQQALLQKQHAMLYSLQGMGGVGKTAIAVHLAYQLRHHFSDGVLWAQLGDSDPMSILATFANAYGLDVSQYVDIGSRSRVVRELLAHKQALIILDNVQSSTEVKSLLPPTGSCAVIITTRHQNLSILRGARRFEIHPFDEEKAESMALFATILDEGRVERERPLFTELANLLGHLPLAVDIAAARLAYEPGWATADFVQRVRQQHRLSELSYEDQSVRLSFNTSYNALSAQQQQFFAALSLFDGHDFSDVAVTAVANVSIEAAQDRLRQLFGMSLIQARQSASGQPARYRLHQLLQTYAQHQLAQHQLAQHQLAQPQLQEKSTVVTRFVHYFVNFINKHKSDYAALDLEMRHILAALEQANAHDMPSKFAQGVNQIYPFLEARGRYDVAATLLAQIDASVDDLETVLATTHHLGRLAKRLGNYIEAETQFEAALALARQQNNQEQLSHLLRELGVLAARRGDYVLAEAYYKEGLRLITQQVGYGSPVSNFLRGLGVQAYMQGHFARAEAFYEEGLALLDRHDVDAEDSRVTGAKLWGLGMLAYEQGSFTQAEAYYLQSLGLARQVNHLERVVLLLRSLALLAHEQKLFDLAASRNNDALMLAREIGHRWQIARCLELQGEIQLALQKSQPAQELFQELYELARMMQSQELIGVALYGLARVTAVTGDGKTAVRYAQESLDTFTAIGHHQVQLVQQWLKEALRADD